MKAKSLLIVFIAHLVFGCSTHHVFPGKWSYKEDLTETSRLRIYHFTAKGDVFLLDYGEEQEGFASQPARHLIGYYSVSNNSVTLKDITGESSKYRFDPKTRRLLPQMLGSESITLTRWPGAIHLYK